MAQLPPARLNGPTAAAQEEAARLREAKSLVDSLTAVNDHSRRAQLLEDGRNGLLAPASLGNQKLTRSLILDLEGSSHQKGRALIYMVEKELGIKDKLVYLYSEKPYFGGDKAFAVYCPCKGFSASVTYTTQGVEKKVRTPFCEFFAKLERVDEKLHVRLFGDHTVTYLTTPRVTLSTERIMLAVKTLTEQEGPFLDACRKGTCLVI